jgi:heme exporter protein A
MGKSTHVNNGTPTLAVAAVGVSKAFGRTQALQRVDLELAWGKCLVLLGHNGAGKSTLLRILAGLTSSDDGTIWAGGYDRRRQPAQLRRAVGFLGHQTLLYQQLTPRENLRFYARLYNLSGAAERASQLLNDVGMGDWADRRVGTLSNGMQKRIALARVLLHRPALLLLDEPETGLDQQGQDLLARVLLAAVRGGASVVMTTHNLKHGLETADQVAILARGRMVFQGPRAGTNVEALQQLLASGAGGDGTP